MAACFRPTHFLLICGLLWGSAVGQQSTSVAPSPSTDPGAAAPGQSLGELARKVRKDHTAEVQMSDADAKELFKSVDKIVAFASEPWKMERTLARSRISRFLRPVSGVR